MFSICKSVFSEYQNIAGIQLVKEFKHANVFAITAKPIAFNFDKN